MSDPNNVFLDGWNSGYESGYDLGYQTALVEGEYAGNDWVQSNHAKIYEQGRMAGQEEGYAEAARYFRLLLDT